MELVFAGIDRAHAPSEVLGALDALDRVALLDVFAAAPDVTEAVVVSDGRRFEAYAVLQCGFDSFEALSSLMAGHFGCASSKVAGCLYAAEGIDAAAHAMHAACGTDSFSRDGSPAASAMRDACDLARRRSVSGEALGRLFSIATDEGSRGRALEAEADLIAAVSAAIDVARLVFDDLARCTVLMVGENRAGLLFARMMGERGASVALVASDDVASERLMKTADIVLACAQGGGCVLDSEGVKRIGRARRGRISVVFDLTEHGCVDPACSNAGDVFVYTLCDLVGLRGRPRMSEARPGADALQRIRAAAHAYMDWFDVRASWP